VKPTRAAALVFLAALLARVLFLCLHGPLLATDSESYLRLAENLAGHGAFSLSPGPPFVPTIRRAPLYPAFLGLLHLAGLLRPGVVAALQAVVDSAVAVAVLVLAARVAGPAWALAAALAYAVHPGAIAAAASLLGEALFTALLVLAVTLLVRGRDREPPALLCAAGAVFGLAALCRPIALFLPFLCAAVLLAGRRAPQRGRTRLLLVPLAALCVIAPWAVRCSRAAGRLVLVQGASAVNVYVPTRWDWDQGDEARLWHVLAPGDEYCRRLTAAGTPAAMAAADAFGYRQAVANVRADTGAYLRSRARTVPHLVLTTFDVFTGFNQSLARARAEGRWARLVVKLALLALFSLLPLALAVIGLFRASGEVAALCVTLWLSTLLVHLPLWIEPRFWLPAVPFLLVGAAGGGAALARRA